MSRTVYIEPHSDFAQVFSLIEDCPESVITLEAPEAGVLHSGFGLRLLLDRFPEKKFQIVSSDPAFKRLAERLGVRVYPKSESIEFEQEYSKTHILRHNFTFFEYLWYEVKKGFSKIRYRFQKKKATSLKYSHGWMFETNLVLLAS